MLQLAIDTAFFSARVSLIKDGKLLETLSEQGFGSAEVLNILVRDVLLKHNFQLKDLDGLFVILGPGSFTGLRVGVAAAQAYSISLSIPLVGVSSLFALANSLGENKNKSTRVALQASKSDFFVSKFRYDDSGIAMPESEVSVESGDAPEHYFENGLAAQQGLSDVAWDFVVNAAEFSKDKEVFSHIQSGLELEIVYGKSVQAKTLEERGVKSFR